MRTTRASVAGNAGIGQKAVSSLTTPHIQDHLSAPSYPTTQPDVETCMGKAPKEETFQNEYEFGKQGFEDVEQVETLEFNYDMHTLNAYECTNNSSNKVKGRLKEHIQFWIDINAPPFILDCICEGYKIPFFSNPERVVLKNNRSAQVHAEFVTGAISELLESSRIRKTHKGHLIVISPLSVAVQQNGKKRLILDLRYVNQHIYKQKFKFEDWRTAINYFGSATYFTKFDLKSGYHHLDIFSEHQPYLGFSWPDSEGETCYYMFTVLPFGLSSAPYIFTKLLRPMIRHWREQGISATIFLDDNIDMEKTFETSNRHAKIIRSDVCKSGFVANDGKSIWTPTQTIIWLGLNWNGINGTLAIAPHRIENLTSAIDEILKQTHVTARTLARIVGQIISTGPVTGNLARIMSRHCQMSIACAQEWDTPFKIDQYCIHELKFWNRNIKLVNSRSFLESVTTNKSIYSDASSTACGAFIEGTNEVAHRMFTKAEQETSSTFRELLAIQLAVQSFEPILTGGNVKLFTDSQMAVKITQVGSMKLDCHKLAINIFSTCARANIQLDLQWIPRSENEKADYLSRFKDFDDWEVVPEIFQQLDAQFGPHTVDCFANYRNAKVPRFFSRFWNPNTAGVDAFYQDWSNEIAWVVPPLPIVPRVILFMYHNKCKGTIVVPHWPSAAYWPILFQQFGQFVTKTVTIRGNIALKQGTNFNSLLGSKYWRGNVLVCSIDFNSSG